MNDLDAVSVLVGLCALPVVAAVWFTCSPRLVVRVVRLVKAGTPSSVINRARVAASVYAARRMFVLRISEDFSVSLSIGHSHTDRQRASDALVNEFVTQPDSQLRVHRR